MYVYVDTIYLTFEVVLNITVMFMFEGDGM